MLSCLLTVSNCCIFHLLPSRGAFHQSVLSFSLALARAGLHFPRGRRPAALNEAQLGERILLLSGSGSWGESTRLSTQACGRREKPGKKPTTPAAPNLRLLILYIHTFSKNHNCTVDSSFGRTYRSSVFLHQTLLALRWCPWVHCRCSVPGTGPHCKSLSSRVRRGVEALLLVLVPAARVL